MKDKEEEEEVTSLYWTESEGKHFKAKVKIKGKLWLWVYNNLTTLFKVSKIDKNNFTPFKLYVPFVASKMRMRMRIRSSIDFVCLLVFI